MIFSKTPFRISFVGGGTDNLKKQNFKGQVVSCTINKYIYVERNENLIMTSDFLIQKLKMLNIQKSKT